MASLLESYTLSVLVFFLEILVYLDNLWYKVIWPRLRPSSTSILDKLIQRKEDEIWHAVIYGNDGDVQKILEDLTNGLGERRTPSCHVSDDGGVTLSTGDPGTFSTSGEVEAGVLSCRPKSQLQKAVETDVAEYMVYGHGSRYDKEVQARLEAIADQLANTSRTLTRKEEIKARSWYSGTFSLLWMAIDQDHKSDVVYLLSKRNQKLHTGNGWQQQTVLHQAVSKKDSGLVRRILENNSSTPPETYINAGDYSSRTALHELVHSSVVLSRLEHYDPGIFLELFDLLSENDANINALDIHFLTPLHRLLSTVLLLENRTETIPLLDTLLWAGAEVQTKDSEGNSPLHIACELQNHEAIENLVLNGADMEALNRDGKTPRRVFLDSHGSDRDFWTRMTNLSRAMQSLSVDAHDASKKLSRSRDRITKARKVICEKSPVYCRYRTNNLATENNNPLYWTAGDISVSDVLYSTIIPFLVKCGEECQLAWEDLFQPSRDADNTNEDEIKQASTAGKEAEVKRSVWRWVNFPANNITWIREFIKSNFEIDTSAQKFFERNMNIYDARNDGSRIRKPHAYMVILITKQRMSKDTGKSSKNHDDQNIQATPMVSLAIPFIDIEVEPEYPSTVAQGEEAYPPFTGMDGAQMPQTLDQTSYNTESLSKLRCKENQVIYRWSQKQTPALPMQLPMEFRVQSSILSRLLRKVRHYTERYQKQKVRDSSFDHAAKAGGGEAAGYSARIQSIRKDRRPKWLMVRQLWLWKLNDGTVLTAIPSRENMCMSDDLLETIRKSNLRDISSGDGLMKHIEKETITFPDKFMRAGLGEHILTIFEGEIASEADEEATFYNNFNQNDWDSKHANKAINYTWRVKDIRDELGLIEKVFSSQLEVVKQFAKVLTPSQAKTTSDPDYIRTLIAELENMIKRIKSMDNDAATTLESLNNITQAMLAQASLKEAESARLMNFIILPFTIVTVIFTPLSFMTSLFAVNSDGFPHNEEGELRIPSDWLWWRMVVGELGTLVPLFIFVLFLYYLRRSPKDLSGDKPGR